MQTDSQLVGLFPGNLSRAAMGAISKEVNKILVDKQYAIEVKNALAEVKPNLSDGRGSEYMVRLVLSCSSKQ